MRYILTCFLLTISILLLHILAVAFFGDTRQLLREPSIAVAAICAVSLGLAGLWSTGWLRRIQPIQVGTVSPHLPTPLPEPDRQGSQALSLPGTARAALDEGDTTVRLNNDTVPSRPTSLFVNEQPERSVIQRLHRPGLATWSFSTPKEGSNPEHSADKLDQYYTTNMYRAAVTDGVSNSFLPAHWAQVIATSYVEEGFSTPYEFVQWLNDCSARWYKWAELEWVPRANEMLGVQNALDYWQREITRGAQTTLIGCSFSPQDLLAKKEFTVHVDAVGDAEFFWVRPPADPKGKWLYRAFALTHAEQFGSHPDTLPTAVHYIEDTWQFVKIQEYLVQPGDYLVLTTDALAQWILTALAQEQNPWLRLFNFQNQQDFCNFVEEQRAKRTMPIDDTTLLIIQLEGPSMW